MFLFFSVYPVFILRTFFITHFIFIMILFHVFVLSFFVLYVESKTLRNISKDYDDTHGKSTFVNYCVERVK
jgi:hypothetical protein